MTAVVRSVKIFGCLKNFLESMKIENKALPWKQTTGMRDKLIHVYFGVDAETLWKAATQNIASLKKSIQLILKKQEKL